MPPQFVPHWAEACTSARLEANCRWIQPLRHACVVHPQPSSSAELGVNYTGMPNGWTHLHSSPTGRYFYPAGGKLWRCVQMLRCACAIHPQPAKTTRLGSNCICVPLKFDPSPVVRLRLGLIHSRFQQERSLGYGPGVEDPWFKRTNIKVVDPN